MKSITRMFSIIILLAAVIMTCSCGGGGMIKYPDQVTQQPTANSAGMVSGFDYATAGERHKVIHSLGGPTMGAAAASEDERHKAR